MTAPAVPTNILRSKIEECYNNAAAITPADNTQIGPFAAIWVGTGGDIVYQPRNSASNITLKSVPSGTLLRIGVQGVNATGTTATDLVGLG